MRTKLRRASDGEVIDRTFRAGEKFRAVRTEVRRMQFLYSDGTDAHFMDAESYEQLTIPESTLAEPLRWMKESEEFELLYIDDSARGRPAAERDRPDGHRDRAGRARRHGVGWRQQAGDARDRRADPGAAVRQHRRRRPGGHALGRVRLACVGASSAAAAVWALYQSDLLGPTAGGHVPAGRARASRARSPTSCASISPSSTS